VSDILPVMKFFAKSSVLSVLDQISGADCEKNRKCCGGKSAVKYAAAGKLFQPAGAECTESIHSLFCKHAQKEHSREVTYFKIMVSRPVNKICDLSKRKYCSHKCETGDKYLNAVNVPDFSEAVHMGDPPSGGQKEERQYYHICGWKFRKIHS